MELPKELEQAMFKLRAIQKKHIRVAIWINDDCNYRKQIYELWKPHELEDGEIIQRFFQIPVYETSNNIPPRGFNHENFDAVYCMTEDKMMIIDYNKIREYFNNPPSLYDD